jgi:glycine hydroxymethyltransferase
MEEAQDYYNNIFSLLKEHQNWFRANIPLIASENIPSPAVREALTSDFGNRYAEGWPGERVYAGCKYLDQVELLCIEEAKKLFNVEFVDVRPISGVVANLSIYTAFTNPGDRIMALSIPAGGHITTGKKEMGGTAGAVHGLRIEPFPFDVDEMNIDVDETRKLIKNMVYREYDSPKIAMFGASVFLFPHPIRELADFLHDVGAYICYDGAHVAGLIAGGLFQQPIGEGADVMTFSTHKTLPGPQHGAILSWEKYAPQIKKATFPGVTSNHHLHHVAALAIAFAEMMEFGREYATQVIKNAKALAQALNEAGFDVLGERHGFTESHQVLVDVSKNGGGHPVEQKLEEANIIINRNLLPYDIKMGRHFQNPGGVRLGTSEITRLGMKEPDMMEIAEYIKKILIDGENSKKVKEDVGIFRKDFQHTHYCFENATEAYKYIGIR